MAWDCPACVLTLVVPIAKQSKCDADRGAAGRAGA